MADIDNKDNGFGSDKTGTDNTILTQDELEALGLGSLWQDETEADDDIPDNTRFDRAGADGGPDNIQTDRADQPEETKITQAELDALGLGRVKSDESEQQDEEVSLSMNPGDLDDILKSLDIDIDELSDFRTKYREPDWETDEEQDGQAKQEEQDYQIIPAVKTDEDSPVMPAGNGSSKNSVYDNLTGQPDKSPESAGLTSYGVGLTPDGAETTPDGEAKAGKKPGFVKRMLSIEMNNKRIAAIAAIIVLTSVIGIGSVNFFFGGEPGTTGPGNDQANKEIVYTPSVMPYRYGEVINDPNRVKKYPGHSKISEEEIPVTAVTELSLDSAGNGLEAGADVIGTSPGGAETGFSVLGTAPGPEDQNSINILMYSDNPITILPVSVNCDRDIMVSGRVDITNNTIANINSAYLEITVEFDLYGVKQKQVIYAYLAGIMLAPDESGNYSYAAKLPPDGSGYTVTSIEMPAFGTVIDNIPAKIYFNKTYGLLEILDYDI